MLQFDENDVPNKYGETRRERAISGLVESGRTLEDAGWEVSEEDRKYYNECRQMYDDMAEAKGGKRPVIIHYLNDWDPD